MPETRKRLLARENLPVWLAALLLSNGLLLALLLGYLAPGHGAHMIRTLEPLLIENPNGDNHPSVLPVGTTLHHDKHFAEGHDRYIVYLYHKGNIAHEEVPMKPEYGGKLIDPLWLSNIAAEPSKATPNRPRLSAQDVLAAIKSNEITRDQLAEILRSLP